MRRRVVPFGAALHSVCSRKTFLNPSTSRAFSNKIIESPTLSSIDIVDSWSSASNLSDQSCSEEWPKNQTTKIIDGRAIAEGIRSRIASEVSRMRESIGQVPGLAVILVGQRRDSQTYVRNKTIASEEHLDEAKILSFISLEKDVDGFHPLNIGHLAMQGMDPLFIPCTAKGCIELLVRSGVEITGKTAVVIGKSNIVGLPTSLLLQRHHATVTVVHALTENPEKIAREADILVTAAGVPDLVRGSWLKPGAVVVDVGTNPIEDCTSEYGYRLVGDVCFDEAMKVASAITPVPEGVGPMTVAMLLCNTLDAAKRAFKFTR